MLPRDFILRQTFMIFIPTTIKNQEATKLTKIHQQTEKKRKAIAAGLDGRTRGIIGECENWGSLLLSGTKPSQKRWYKTAIC